LIPLLVAHMGRTRYADAWKLQQEFWTHRHEGAVQDILLLTEHDHVYTLGKSTDDNHLLASEEELRKNGTDVFHVDRGGDITYHGPGQIVGYPILDLNNYFLDIHRYLRSLEEVIIHALVGFGILAEREKDMTGVWVKGEKIAAIGVKVSRWVTMHGFALNVQTDLTKFDRIIPCGIFHKGVTSMQRVLGQEVPIESVQKAIVDSFAGIFGCSPQWIEKDTWMTTLKGLQAKAERENTVPQSISSASILQRPNDKEYRQT
jgi:lipoyl(octanoyl) transferase